MSLKVTIVRIIKMDNRIFSNTLTAKSIETGYEAKSISILLDSQGNPTRVYKEYDPEKMHVPTIGGLFGPPSITDPYKIAEYKLKEADFYYRVFGDSFAVPEYVIKDTNGELTIAAFQEYIPGQKLSRQIVTNNPAVRSQYRLMLEILTTYVNNNPQEAKEFGFDDMYIPTAEEIFDPDFEPPRQMPDLVNFGNYIWNNKTEKLILIDF